MDVAFAGTPAFAADVLSALLGAGFTVPLVLTQPDRPSGRGQKLVPSPVKRLATEHGIAVAQPAYLADPDVQMRIQATAVDVLAVAAYGLIVPPAILGWPRCGSINVHASLLPRWRGAAPIARAILAGDRESGVTIMQMDAGLDTGPMLDSVRVAIERRETAGSLEAKLARAAPIALVGVLQRLARGETLTPVPQVGEGITYATKIDKREADVDWRGDAVAIDRQIRAFDPAPGARTLLDREPLKIWRAEPFAAAVSGVAPGTITAVVRRSIVVACGTGALRVDEVQPASGKRMPAASFAAGRRLVAGMRFGADGG